MQYEWKSAYKSRNEKGATYKNFNEFSQLDCMKWKNIINYNKETSKLFCLMQDTQPGGPYMLRAEKSINFSNALISDLLHRYVRYLNKFEFLPSKRTFPSFLYKIYIEVLLQNSKIEMKRNNFTECDKLFSCCFSCIRKYFESETHIYAITFISYGEYMSYRKHYALSDHCFKMAYSLLRHTYASNFCNILSTNSIASPLN